MSLAQKLTHRPMEQKGEPRIKSQGIQSTNIRQGGQGHPVRKRQSLQKNYAWKTGETHVEWWS